MTHNPNPQQQRFYRRVIRVTAECSPNVRYALAQRSQGLEPDGKVILPGVLPWDEYLKRRSMWDPVRQCIGLDAQFYKGAEVLLYPPEWLNRAEQIALALDSGGGDNGSKGSRRALAIGCDPAEGGDKSSWSVVDELGLLDQVSLHTPDTTIIPNTTLALMERWQVPSDRVVLDRGGGGKQHADELRRRGYSVRTVAFGESIEPELKRGKRTLTEKVDVKEDHYAYRNRRGEMYGELRQILDPTGGIYVKLSVSEMIGRRNAHIPQPQQPSGSTPSVEKNPHTNHTNHAQHGIMVGGVNGFGIPSRFAELRRQISPLPLTYDQEGRLELLPKNRRAATDAPGNRSTKPTLVALLGCSPDEADSFVLALHGMLHHSARVVAGAMW